MNFISFFSLLVFFMATFTQAAGYLQLTGGLNMSHLNTPDGNPALERQTIASLRSHKAYLKPGFNIGLAYEYFFMEYLGVQAGVSYETRGEGGSIGFLGADADEDSSWEYRYRYLQVPVNIIGSLPLSGGHAIEVMGGIELGRMMGNGEYELFGRDSGDYISAIYPDSFAAIVGEEKNDYGCTIGIGYKYLVPFGAMYIRPSYYFSMKNLNAAGKKHRNLKIQVGYGIGF